MFALIGRFKCGFTSHSMAPCSASPAGIGRAQNGICMRVQLTQLIRPKLRALSGLFRVRVSRCISLTPQHAAPGFHKLPFPVPFCIISCPSPSALTLADPLGQRSTALDLMQPKQSLCHLINARTGRESKLKVSKLPTCERDLGSVLRKTRDLEFGSHHEMASDKVRGWIGLQEQ